MRGWKGRRRGEEAQVSYAIMSACRGTSGGPANTSDCTIVSRRLRWATRRKGGGLARAADVVCTSHFARGCYLTSELQHDSQHTG